VKGVEIIIRLHFQGSFDGLIGIWYFDCHVNKTEWIVRWNCSLSRSPPFLYKLLSVWLPISAFVSFFVSVCFPVCLCVCLYVSLYIRWARLTDLTVWQSLYTVCLSVCLSASIFLFSPLLILSDGHLSRLNAVSLKILSSTNSFSKIVWIRSVTTETGHPANGLLETSLQHKLWLIFSRFWLSSTRS